MFTYSVCALSTQKLDGEFAILILDFEKDSALIATDPFKTKPLFYSTHN